MPSADRSILLAGGHCDVDGLLPKHGVAPACQLRAGLLATSTGSRLCSST